MANMGLATASSILNAMFRNTPYSPAATVYLALYTSDPTSADLGTEVTGGAYARRPVNFAAPVDSSVGGVACKQTRNSGAVTFPTATAAWATSTNPIAYWALRTAATGGVMLAFGSFSNSKVVDAGDQFVVADGAITINIY